MTHQEMIAAQHWTRNNTTITDRLKKLKSFHNGSYGADIDEAIKAIEALEEIKEIEKHWAACGNPVESMIAISEILTDKDKQEAEGERLVDFIMNNKFVPVYEDDE